jgi:hypothetical protein
MTLRKNSKRNRKSKVKIKSRMNLKCKVWFRTLMFRINLVCMIYLVLSIITGNMEVDIIFLFVKIRIYKVGLNIMTKLFQIWIWTNLFLKKLIFCFMKEGILKNDFIVLNWNLYLFCLAKKHAKYFFLCFV